MATSSEPDPSVSGDDALRGVARSSAPDGLPEMMDVRPFVRALARAALSASLRPTAVFDAARDLARGQIAATTAAVGRAFGASVPGPTQPAAGDRRFKDVAFEQNPLYFLLAQHYLLAGQFGNDLLDAAQLDPADHKTRLAASFLLDAFSPTNTLVGNPAAMRKAFDTGGSAWHGASATSCATSATTEDGRRRSIGRRSRSA